MGKRRAKPSKKLSLSHGRIKNEAAAYEVLKILSDVNIPADFSINDPIWLYCGKGENSGSHLKIKHLLYARAALGE